LNVESSYLEPLRSLSCKWEQRVSKNDSRHAYITKGRAASHATPPT
jgi:hypothetical protein